MSNKIHLFKEKKTDNIFKLIRIEKNFEKDEAFGEQFSLLEGLGDNRPKTLKMNKFHENYIQLSEEDKNKILFFITNNVNIHSLPIKFSDSTIKFGSIREAYRPPYILEINPNSEDLKEPNENLNQVDIKIGQLLDISSTENFNSVILDEDIKQNIINSINKLKIQTFLTNNWNFKDTPKNVFNFYGQPGTGKTLSAKAIANYLNQKLLQVDYSQVESKWIGETGKNIQKIFQTAKDNNAIILFDEADSLVSKRTVSGDQISQHMNLNRNVFMQELDKFNGIVILTTNLFQNYDAALLRRINQHYEFKLPDEQSREQLFKSHLPIKVPLSNCVNIAELAKTTTGFSGGDIYNIVKEAIYSSAIKAFNLNNLESAKLTQKDFLEEITKIRTSKQSHKGILNKKPIGLQS